MIDLRPSVGFSKTASVPSRSPALASSQGQIFFSLTGSDIMKSMGDLSIQELSNKRCRCRCSTRDVEVRYSTTAKETEHQPSPDTLIYNRLSEALKGYETKLQHSPGQCPHHAYAIKYLSPRKAQRIERDITVHARHPYNLARFRRADTCRFPRICQSGGVEQSLKAMTDSIGKHMAGAVTGQ